ncbi:MAG: FKBP-type peptidyl-prolyl cis-trans isomerase [Pseudomonadales bacterium]|jgi:FKBP-type peptidyl-prolyl cis-trans isomerase FklB|nr:FKBP-type peptidyl-prolyl cis-trans isomerase [Pseudomonadales bacterium]
MNKFLYAFVAIAIVFLAGCQNKETEASAPETRDQKLAYAVGIQYGSRLKQDFETLDFDAFSQGVQHAFGDIEPILSEEDMVDAFKQYKQKRMAIESAKNETSSAKNIAEGKAFLEAKAKEEGVTVLTSGVQYRVLSSGPEDAMSPTASNTVSVHYRGTLIDGTEFDSSYARGEPAQFPVHRVIPGWIEILQLMKTGDKWQVYIPSASAYGARGAGGDIGPNATLIFDIELLEIIN